LQIVTTVTEKCKTTSRSEPNHNGTKSTQNDGNTITEGHYISCQHVKYRSTLDQLQANTFRDSPLKIICLFRAGMAHLLTCDCDVVSGRRRSSAAWNGQQRQRRVV